MISCGRPILIANTSNQYRSDISNIGMNGKMSYSVLIDRLPNSAVGSSWFIGEFAAFLISLA